MMFTEELHYCTRCGDFVPYVSAVRGASCVECGRPFNEADERAYLRYRRWGSPDREPSLAGLFALDGRRLSAGHAG